MTSNLTLLQMPTKVVSYIYTRLSDIEDVDLLDVTLFNEEDVELSGPFDDEQVSTEVEEDGQEEVELAKDDGLEEVSENTLEEELYHDLGI